MKRIKKIISILTVLALTVPFFMFNSITAQADDASDVAQFPESYKRQLRELKSAHPSWTFVPVFTGLDWSSAVAAETSSNRSLISYTANNYCKGDLYGQGWYYATSEAVAYYMDPRNSLTDERIFQFMDLKYHMYQISVEDIENFLSTTFMSSQKGTAPGTDMSFALIFSRCGEEFNVSPFHLASRVYQEQGLGNSPLISGKCGGYEGYYNYFNVGASGKTNDKVIESGLNYARNKGWTNAYLSIRGGTELIVSKYVANGQNTIYFEKFNVKPGNSYGNYTHQYMQNIVAPMSEAKTMYSEYAGVGKLDTDFVFEIPVYNNMPRGAAPFPSDKSRDFVRNGVDYSAVYDPDYYYDHNKDLAIVLGYDKERLLNHFLEYGMREGRKAISTFDVNIYKWNSYDLECAFGDDLPSYYMHYITNGQYESDRNATEYSPTKYHGVDYSAVYDPEYYYNTYKDVAAAFGYDEKALIKHFVEYGMREGRCGNDKFNVLKYKYSFTNRDLKDAFGDDLPAYYIHYISCGKAEGRNVSQWDGVFNAEYYLKKNPDVKAHIYALYTENSNIEGWCLWHYLEYGISEGRYSGTDFDVMNYATANPDVFKANSYYDEEGRVHTDFVGIATHYLESGLLEGRPTENGVYNMRALPELRPDVIDAFGYDRAAWCDWFITYGGN